MKEIEPLSRGSIPQKPMAVVVEGVGEEAVDTAVEAMVEDVSMDTMVVVGGGGCRKMWTHESRFCG
ncbi:hypothetical protein HID58_094542 [Brassica napus]|uniref:Uncharacterized protein n=1 Tax=Brassica napus TaxID=3708 RepID=A0ABQ7X2K4_BRANA|nr:hypothetical protein HID58_095848 [Brassica napus]KAH0851682.1 hypothetical protein HID58_094542 [Brassica napus]